MSTREAEALEEAARLLCELAKGTGLGFVSLRGYADGTVRFEGRDAPQWRQRWSTSDVDVMTTRICSARARK